MKILIPGCGTGQIFDYLDFNLFSGSQLIFTELQILNFIKNYFFYTLINQLSNFIVVIIFQF